MENLIDVHTHLIPYVDDGAQNLFQAQKMLEAQCAQGVTKIFVTPHHRKNMFETSDEKIEQHFDALQTLAQNIQNPPELFLGREYFCDTDFFALLSAGNLKTLGNGNHVLCEFSTVKHSADYILQTATAVLDAGYRPVIAHVERYNAVWQTPELLDELVAMGAMLQMNTGSILGRSGFKTARFCKQLLKKQKIHLIASDTHDLAQRKPNLGDCAKRVQRLLPKVQAEQLLFENPKRLLKTAVLQTT